FIQNRHASPEAAFQDTIQVTMARHHFRARPWTEKVLKELDLERSFRIYQDRFADASDFTFIFVGHFDPEAIKPLVLTYLGSLPALRRHETWRDVGIRPPKGVVTKEVHKGLEPKSEVSLIFTGPFAWNRQNRYNLNAMTTVLRIKLREILREELSGTYGVGVWSSASRYPDQEYSVHIAFGCAPDRVEELTRMVFKEIDSLKTFGTTEKYLQKVKETQRRERETALKENGFWLRSLRSVYFHRADPMNILNYDTLIDNLTLEDIQTAARRYLNTENYVRVVLYPRAQEENSGQEKKP
ncbi:MAG: insulinase family protein, partial [Calditrichaeota bacterium]